jgi:hypothetical protein
MAARKTRKLLAALCVFALLVGVTVPAYASSNRSMSSMMEGTDPVSPTLDVLILRPVGLIVTIGGAVAYGVTAAIVGITRPKDIAKPLEPLVLAPARYTFVDPIGHH